MWESFSFLTVYLCSDSMLTLEKKKKQHWLAALTAISTGKEWMAAKKVLQLAQNQNCLPTRSSRTDEKLTVQKINRLRVDAGEPGLSLNLTCQASLDWRRCFVYNLYPHQQEGHTSGLLLSMAIALLLRSAAWSKWLSWFMTTALLIRAGTWRGLWRRATWYFLWKRERRKLRFRNAVGLHITVSTCLPRKSYF